MVIEERGRERNASRETFCVVGFQQTVLVVVADGNSDGPVGSDASRKAQVVVGSVCVVINLVVPVGACCSE